MKQIYLAHPFTDGMTIGSPGATRNLARAKLWYRWACVNYPDRLFNMAWVMDIEVFSGPGAAMMAETEDSRALGMKRNFARIKSCYELWLMGESITAGMIDEAVFAQRCCIPVYDFTSETLSPHEAPRFPPEDMVQWKAGSLSQQVMK